MTRVLLVANTTGYQIRSFGTAAERLGIRLSLATDRCDRLDDPWRDAAIPVRFHDEAESVAAVIRAWGNGRPDGILAVGDRPTLLAAHLSAAFGLPGNPPEAAHAARNKLEAKCLFREAGLPTADFRSVSAGDDGAALGAQLDYPVVIKPLALSGSRGVMRADSPRDFSTAFARLRTLLRMPDVRVERDPAHSTILIERFIPGDEFAIEGVLTNGAFQPFAVFDKPDPLDGPFFEETIYVTPSRQPEAVQRDMVVRVAAATAALGLRHGPVHAECRVNESGVYVLEVAARPIGGLCSRALRFTQRGGASETATLEEVLLRHAIGEDAGAWVREEPAAGVMMLPIPRRGVLRRVDGVDAACALPGIEDVRITAKTDSVIVPLPEGRSYLGFAFARASRAADVESALRRAHAALDPVIDPDLPVVN